MMKIEINLSTEQAIAVAETFKINPSDRDAKEQLEDAIKQQLRVLVRSNIQTDEEHAKNQRVQARLNHLGL